MFVWLPINLIFDKLLVISAREGLSGIPGQPTTCQTHEMITNEFISILLIRAN